MPLSDLETKCCITDASASTGIMKYRREYPPAHYSLKVESFSLLSQTKLEKYETGSFEAGGYKWSLLLYPNGDKNNNGSGYISLYLAIDEPNGLPHGWEVNVSFRLFVLNQIRNIYLTFEDVAGGIKLYHALKTEWGFSQLMSLETFKEASNGYLVDDTCVFGAEVFVVKSTGKWESLSMIKEPRQNKYTWKIDEFSKLDNKSLYSEKFSIGEHNWKLKIYPKGYGNESDKSITIFLELLEAGNLPPKRKIYGDYVLRVHDQLNISHWFWQSSFNWGFPGFLSLDDLHKPANGYLYNDKLVVEVEILMVSAVKVHK